MYSLTAYIADMHILKLMLFFLVLLLFTTISYLLFSHNIGMMCLQAGTGIAELIALEMSKQVNFLNF